MASETETLTSMQFAMINAGLLDEDRALRVNRIKHDQTLRKARQNKRQTAENNNVTKFRNNLRKSA